MRIGRRWLGAAIAGLLLLVLLALGAIALVRWRAAGVAHPIAPPAGAVPFRSVGGPDDRVVQDRALIIARSLRNDRGAATVRIYELAPGSPWLQARKTVATQLDHWEQLGGCADHPDAAIVECSWREPTRWWPRNVQLTLLRTAQAAGQSGAAYLIVGSGTGE